MSAALIVAVGMALAFAFTNGLHDAANAIATLVATRAARPGPAIVLAAAGNVVGPLILGKAVADTIAGIVIVPDDEMVFVLGAALTGAVAWNAITWWRALPSSSGHALLGGLVGAALVEGGTGAVNWGGFDGIKPVGVLGVLGVLALAPVLGFLAGLVVNRSLRQSARRATTRMRGPVRAGQWTMSGGLALSHGANDAQKSIGIVAALLVAAGETAHLTSPVWAELACGVALDRGHHTGRLAHHPHDRTAHHSAATARCAVESDRVHGGAPRSIPDRRTGQYDPGGDVVGGRCRGWSATLAPRPLATRAHLGARLVGDHPRRGRDRRSRAAALEVAHVSKHWFLPKNPDLLGLLCEQSTITVDGMQALVAWAAGADGAGDRVREYEHQADDKKRQLWRELRDAFSPPIDAEDLFSLSSDLDEVLNAAKNLVREIRSDDHHAGHGGSRDDRSDRRRDAVARRRLRAPREAGG